MIHTPMFRVLEVVLYTLINSLPYHFCTLYVFREQLRLSLPKTLLCLLPATLLELAMNLLVVFGGYESTALVNFLWALGYFATYCFLVREPMGKVGFLVLVLLNLNNFVIVASKYTESLIFREMSMERYHLSNFLTMAITELLLVLPHFITLHKRYLPAMKRPGNSFLWRYLWLIPATFYFLWYYHIHFDSSSSLEVATDLHTLFFLTVITCGSYLIYYIVLRLVNESANNAQLRASNYQLELQTLQFENLQERIAETRKANHDLRHHITVMQSCLDDGDYQRLHTYFDTLKARTPTTSVSYCQHPTVNALLVYFGQLAKENGISFTVKLDLPAQLSIPGNDLAVLIGNLVENAVEACIAQDQGEKKVLIAGRIAGGRLLLTIDNTYSRPTRQDISGVYLSSKHAGHGIGIESAKSIARRNGGDLRIQQQDGMFCISISMDI